MVEDRAAKDFRSTVKEKMEYREQRQNSRFVYAMSILLVVVVLAIGISTMNNFDKMESVQNTLETLSLALSSSEGSGQAEAKEKRYQDGVLIDGETGEETAVTAGTVPETSTIQEELGNDDFYIVQKGDTLDTISVKLYGDTGHVEAICKMNGLSDGNLIFIGQKLLLP